MKQFKIIKCLMEKLLLYLFLTGNFNSENQNINIGSVEQDMDNCNFVLV